MLASYEMKRTKFAFRCFFFCSVMMYIKCGYKLLLYARPGSGVAIKTLLQKIKIGISKIAVYTDSTIVIILINLKTCKSKT